MSVSSLIALYERHAVLTHHPVPPPAQGNDIKPLQDHLLLFNSPPVSVQPKFAVPRVEVQEVPASDNEAMISTSNMEGMPSFPSSRRPSASSKYSEEQLDRQTISTTRRTLSSGSTATSFTEVPSRSQSLHSVNTRLLSVPERAALHRHRSVHSIDHEMPSPTPQPSIDNMLAYSAFSSSQKPSVIRTASWRSGEQAGGRRSLANARSFDTLVSNGTYCHEKVDLQECHSPSQSILFQKGASINQPSNVPSGLGHLGQAQGVWQLPPLPLTIPLSQVLCPKPKASFQRLSSLDNLIAYHEEKSEWKRTSSVLRERLSQSGLIDLEHPDKANVSIVFTSARTSQVDVSSLAEKPAHGQLDGQAEKGFLGLPSNQQLDEPRQSKFRHFAAEVGFCFTIAMTQFLAEYLISGFAIVLPKLTSAGDPLGAGSLSSFWPATLLSLIMSATLLVFARLSDMHGGYPYFMFGVFWLAIWTLIPGFFKSVIVLDIARSMQGLAIAAFTPSTFAMVGSIYSEGPRRNFVLGLYGAMAPLGFFAGLLAGGGLDQDNAEWYNWGASILAFVVAIIAYLSVPADRTNRQKLGLKMDWVGAILITSGLILLAYALAVEPYAGQMQGSKSGFGHPIVYGPFVLGCLCLVTAVYIEGWFAKCPLLPFDFFKPKSVKGFCFACLCFYACYGAWLYNSTDYFKSTSATGREHEVGGLELALWYTPTAVGGILFCVISGALLHIVPIKALLLLSALAWIGAPLVLAVCPTPLNYWSTVLPSTVCATLGIDLTFTVSIVFLSSVQPLRYQALAGAVCSILVNLAMSFGLPISEIVSQRASEGFLRSHGLLGTDLSNGLAAPLQDELNNWKYKTTFIYAAASAGLGFIICLAFVNISRSVVSENVAEQDDSNRVSSRVSTLVGEADRPQLAPHSGVGKETMMYSNHDAV